MKFFFPLVSISLANASCIAPRTGFRTCGPCDDIRGSQCVTLEGRWFSCYTDYQQCCSDWQIRNNQPNVAQCVTDSQKAANQPTTPSPTRILPDVSDVCKQVASRGTSKTNIQCMTDCDSLVSAGGDPKTDTLFNQSCVWAHWHATNGRTVVDGPCFEKWIYGYSQENSLASFVKGLSTDTPAQCQALCQDNDACINWAWVSSLYGTSASCLLKDETMVSKALSIRTDIMGDPSMDTQYCNYGMPHECSTNHYVCLPCDGGHKRCVWESDMHVTGWKYCTPVDTCNPTPYSPIDARTGKIPTPRPTTTPPKPTTIMTTTTQKPTPEPTPEPTPPTTAAPETPKPTPTTTPPTTAAPETPKPTPTTTPPTTAAPEPRITTPEPTPPTTVAPETPKPTPTTTPPTTAAPETPKPTPITAATPEPTPKPINPEQTTATPKTESVAPLESSTTPVHISPSASMSAETKATTRGSWWPFPDIFPHNDGTETSTAVQSTAECNCPPVAPENCPSRDSCEPRNDPCSCSCGCVPPPPPPPAPRNDCHQSCQCRGKPDCKCCKQPMLLIRLADRPKKFQVNLEN